MRNLEDGVALETLGCKLNQAESEALAGQLADRGYRIARPSEGASVYILNTCTVTHVADRKSRHLLRLARRRNPQALIIATGCYAERAADELARIAEVDVVVGNRDKASLPRILAERGCIPNQSRPHTQTPGNNRTRSMVKVQEGCNQRCSYCIVPAVRGRERSLPLEEIMSQVKARLAMGYREVVLTGTQIGSYEDGLATLVRGILDETGVERLRLSSLQPQDITPELLALWTEFPQRLCRHLHLPLQSGSDAVLRRMGRLYSTSEYERALMEIREAIPDVAITTDVIVGFPAESDAEFEEGFRFCQKTAFSNIHVFPYSERPGSPAASLPHKVDEEVKRERSERMLKLARDGALDFRKQFTGHTMTILWEREMENGVWSGLTDNYIRVVGRSGDHLENSLTPARLREGENHCLEATLAP